MRGKIRPSDIPEEIKQQTERIWGHIRGLVQFDAKDEPRIVMRIAAQLLVGIPGHGDQ